MYGIVAGTALSQTKSEALGLRRTMKLNVVLLFATAALWQPATAASRPKLNCDKSLTRTLCGDQNSSFPCQIDIFNDGDCATAAMNDSMRLFHTKMDNSADALANVKLTPHQYNSYIRTYPNLNVSFTNINFTSVFMKLSVKDPNKVKCINMTVRDQNQIQNLFYDCRWLGEQHQFVHHPMTFEYHATNFKLNYSQYKKWHFRFPNNTNTTFENYQVLIYREESENNIKFYWSSPPEEFKTSSYRVTLHCASKNSSEEETTNNTSYCPDLEPGNSYYISVKPCRLKGDKEECGSPSYSDPVSIVAHSNTSELPLLVLGIVLLILSVLGCWYAIRIYSSWKLEKCMVVYEPSTKDHLAVVQKVVLFLESLGVPVVCEATHFKNNESLDDWYGRELVDAELILIMPNPPALSEMSSISIYYSFYKNECGKSQLKSLIPSKNCIRIKLPYCEEKHFYDFTRPCRSLKIIEDRCQLLNEIMGPKVWLPRCIAWGLFYPKFKTNEWNDLKDAIRQAENCKVKGQVKSETRDSPINIQPHANGGNFDGVTDQDCELKLVTSDSVGSEADSDSDSDDAESEVIHREDKTWARPSWRTRKD